MKRDNWTTPQKLFDFLNEKFKFNVDAAASNRNTKCKEYYSATTSFLKYGGHKGDRIWCNPPYSMDKEFAVLLSQMWRILKIPSVLLLPVRSDRVWYQALLHTDGVRNVPFTGRIHFGGSGKGAFMYSILIINGFWEVKMPDWLDAGQFNAKGRGSATT